VGINDSNSPTSDDVNVSGQSLSAASISVTTVSKVVSNICCLPRVFFNAVFVRPTILSQKPLHHGALLGMNFQVTPCLPNWLCTFGDCIKDCSSSAPNK